MEKTLKKNLVYKGKILELYNDDVLCENNVQSKREIVSHNGGAAVLLVNKSKQVLLIKQYRYAYGEELFEIPAGKLEKGEGPYNAALRELEEETGCKTDKLESLGVIYPTCGYSNEKIYLYLARSFITTATNFDIDESIESKWYDIKDCLKMIEEGTIKDAKTIVAISNYLNFKK